MTSFDLPDATLHLHEHSSLKSFQSGEFSSNLFAVNELNWLGLKSFNFRLAEDNASQHILEHVSSSTELKFIFDEHT